MPVCENVQKCLWVGYFWWLGRRVIDLILELPPIVNPKSLICDIDLNQEGPPNKVNI